jgi:hypothetical protein
MGPRVLLIVVGGVIYVILREYFDLPRSVSALLGLVPFALAESKGLIGPYEKSARDIMHEKDETKS